MSVRDAAGVLGVHVNTVRNLIEAGALTPLPRPTSGRGSHAYALDPADVRRLARARVRRRTGRTPAERAAYKRGLLAKSYRPRGSSTS